LPPIETEIVDGTELEIGVTVRERAACVLVESLARIGAVRIPAVPGTRARQKISAPIERENPALEVVGESEPALPGMK
jgi:hypothetical protein